MNVANLTDSIGTVPGDDDVCSHPDSPVHDRLPVIIQLYVCVTKCGLLSIQALTQIASGWDYFELIGRVTLL